MSRSAQDCQSPGSERPPQGRRVPLICGRCMVATFPSTRDSLAKERCLHQRRARPHRYETRFCGSRQAVRWQGQYAPCQAGPGQSSTCRSGREQAITRTRDVDCERERPGHRWTVSLGHRHNQIFIGPWMAIGICLIVSTRCLQQVRWDKGDAEGLAALTEIGHPPCLIGAANSM